MFKKLALSMIAVPLLTSCVSLRSVSLTQIPKVRKNEIKAESTRTVFFGLMFDSAVVDDALSQLNAQCTDGRIVGILTKFEDRTLFPFIAQKRISASGYCQRGQSKVAGAEVDSKEVSL